MTDAPGEWRPLHWTGESLVIVDQTALPDEERLFECRTIDDVAAAIREMRVRGAPAIGISAVAGLALAVQRAAREGGDWRRALSAGEGLLKSTRPTAADLFHGLHVARQRVASAVDAAEAAGLLGQLVQELLDRQWAIDRALAEYGAGLLRSGTRALTHCNTGALGTGAFGTALGIIRRAYELGRLEHVWVTETRPRLQGARLTVWELRRCGIPHTLIVDGAAPFLLSRREVDAVLVGADRVAANGDVANKIGTLGLAVAAERFRVPFYVAAPLSTFDPETPDGNAIPIEERDPAEVLRLKGVWIAPVDTPVRNPAFDVTPHWLVTALITERGVIPAPDRRKIANFLATSGPGVSVEAGQTGWDER